MMENKKPITIYYVVGQPRSGSTFVGDWLARKLSTINAGEVWQTFRSLKLVYDANFEKNNGRWVQPEARKNKNTEIKGNPFWSEVLLQYDTDPYAALVSVSSRKSCSLIDTSKTDKGIVYYRSLGYKVIVIHTIRSFTSWAESMNKYQSRYKLKKYGIVRLLHSYVKSNLAYRRYRKCGEYYVVKQENLHKLEQELSEIKKQKDGEYLRCEMFGTTGFVSTYKDERSSKKIKLLDKIIYKLVL
ncbi:hypothetical protein [Cobetia amphilecti]|uniref:hypothetical protein n=1 Tax=Cobetia amphilecti TaxID=1055104 RepID=UPI001C08D1B6|nr:hypothetical protein [Cobetia amphilecti]MBU3007659.1 hypothetical protein [Cobetia amphilecti]